MRRSSMKPLIWAHGATVLVAGALPRPHQPMEILAARWDASNDCFILESRIPVRVPGDAGLVAAGLVSDFETGLFQSYLVFEQQSRLSVWCLDPDDETLELLAELSLASSGGPKTSIQDCWLADGPTIFAVFQEQLLVVTWRDSDRGPNGAAIELPKEGGIQTDHLKPNAYTWEASRLAVTDSSLHQSLTIHFCGEINRSACPEAILSVGAVDSMQLRASPNPGRSPASWSYLSAVEHTNDPSTTQCPGYFREQMNQPFKLVLSEHIPTDLEPSIIACIQTIPATPCSGDDPNDVLIGTKDKRLLRCQRGQVIKVIHLDGIPTQLHFAVVAEGQGVIIVVLNNSQQNVLALCAESHQILQDWSRIWQVVAGDFSLSGHDQIVLFQGCDNSIVQCELYNPLAQDGLEVISIHGFSNIHCPDTPQGSQQHLKEVKAINEHQIAGLETIAKALNERVEVGLAELKVAEKEIQSKRELYRLSNQVMQGMAVRWTLETNSSPLDDKSVKQDQLQVVQATQIEDRICGMAWFLLADVEVLAARSDTILCEVSLHLTSLNGSISGRSTVLKSLSYQDGSRRLALSIPLQTLSLLPGFPFHIFLNASHVFIGKSSSKLHPATHEDVHERCRRMYTQWLGCRRVMNPTSLRPLSADEASTLMKTACEQRQFVVEAEDEQSIFELAGRMRSSLFMEDSPDEKHQQSPGLFNLMAMNGLGIATANGCCIGKNAIVTLKTSNPQLMAMLQESFINLVHHHQLRFLPRICYLETLEKVSKLADALVEDLRLTNSLKQTKDTKRLESEGSRDQDEFSSLQVQRLQMLTDRKCSEVLSLWS